MNKQFQGSKKKARKMNFLKRQLRREGEKQKFQRAMESGSIEEMASVMGVKLR
jgi:hypothetical protein